MLASSAVRGDPYESADTEAARRHYLSGRDLYGQGEYALACTEFATARKILTLPALDYNLAKCEERLEHWARAIEIYERYLGEVGPEVDTTPVRTSIGELRVRVAELKPPPSPSPERMSRLRIAAISLTAGAVVLGAAGTGAYLGEWKAYADRRSSCQGGCAPSSLTGLSNRIDRARDAGYALWGIAGAVAVVDVVLWTIDAKQHRERRSSWEVRF
jgi:hypothetical protein